MAVIGIILSGSGVKDGSEIHEATLAALHLQKQGATLRFAAPDAPQAVTVDHLTGRSGGAQRNMLVESARIARGEIVDLATMNASDLDGIVLPGGFGAALNLCDFAPRGGECQVNPEVQRVVSGALELAKPVGALCIAPVVVAAVCRDMGIEGVKLTIGRDQGTAEKLQQMGARHVECSATEVCVDPDHRVVTSPAYMLAENMVELDEGISAWSTAYYSLLR